MTRCKSCGGGIDFNLVNGRWHPVQPETGKPHWPRCKARTKKLRKPEISEGVPITGERYRPSCGQCSIPPWEVCACSALLADVTLSNARITPSPQKHCTDLFTQEADERLRLLLAA